MSDLDYHVGVADALDSTRALFDFSVRLSEHTMALRQQLVGKTLDVAGAPATITSVDRATIHAKDASGKTHAVPLNPKKHAALLTPRATAARPRRASPKASVPKK